MIGDTTLTTHRVRYSAAYPMDAERMLEPRYGCARAVGVGLPERSKPDGMARPQVALRSEVARGLSARGRARA